MGDDDIKRLILGRRARFVAAAVAGLNAAMCGGSTEPQACLSVAGGGGDAGAEADPQPCLTPIREDSGPGDAGDGGDAGDAGDEGGPQPCLTPPIDGG